MAPSPKPQAAESLCSVTPLQNGVGENREEPHTARRLADQTGSKGCLSDNTHVSTPPKISQVSVAGSDVAVQGPTLRPKLGSFYIYQDHEACGVSPEKARDQVDPVLGRHAGVESVEREAVVPPCVSPEAPDITGVPGQSQQEHSDPDQEVGVPGVPDRLNPDGYLSPKAQDSLNHSVGKQPSDQGEGESERAGKDSGHNGCSSPGSPPSPTPLPLPGKCQVLSPQTGPLVPSVP